MTAAAVLDIGRYTRELVLDESFRLRRPTTQVFYNLDYGHQTLAGFMLCMQYVDIMAAMSVWVNVILALIMDFALSRLKSIIVDFE